MFHFKTSVYSKVFIQPLKAGKSFTKKVKFFYTFHFYHSICFFEKIIIQNYNFQDYYFSFLELFKYSNLIYRAIFKSVIQSFPYIAIKHNNSVYNIILNKILQPSLPEYSIRTSI